jgi:hypothetical protein
MRLVMASAGIESARSGLAELAQAALFAFWMEQHWNCPVFF